MHDFWLPGGAHLVQEPRLVKGVVLRHPSQVSAKARRHAALK